ncbi:hypothetical protein Plhal304r1_c031g0100861 [Plasmopara halstedii]
MTLSTPFPSLSSNDSSRFKPHLTISTPSLHRKRLFYRRTYKHVGNSSTSIKRRKSSPEPFPDDSSSFSSTLSPSTTQSTVLPPTDQSNPQLKIQPHLSPIVTSSSLSPVPLLARSSPCPSTLSNMIPSLFHHH